MRKFIYNWAPVIAYVVLAIMCIPLSLTHAPVPEYSVGILFFTAGWVLGVVLRSKPCSRT